MNDTNRNPTGVSPRSGAAAAPTTTTQTPGGGLGQQPATGGPK